MSALKWITAEAKKIRRQYPKRFKTWREYVAQASAIYASKHKGKSPVGKKHPKKVSGVKKTKKPARNYGSHKDTKSHNVNIRVVSGLDKVTRKGKKTIVYYSRIMGLPQYQDKDAAREIELFADNDSQLYYQRRKPIILNLQKKYKKGTFDVDKAAKLWRYYIDAAMQKYHKEFGSRGDKWSDLLSVHDRNLLSHEYAENIKNEFDLGNFY